MNIPPSVSRTGFIICLSRKKKKSNCLVLSIHLQIIAAPEAIEISNKPNLTNFYNLHYIPQAFGDQSRSTASFKLWLCLYAGAVVQFAGLCGDHVLCYQKTADRETTDGSDRFNAYADLSCKHLFLRCHDHRQESRLVLHTCSPNCWIGRNRSRQRISSSLLCRSQWHLLKQSTFRLY